MGVRDFAQTGLRKFILKYLGAGAGSTEMGESEERMVRVKSDFSDQHVEPEVSSRFCQGRANQRLSM